MKRGYLIDMDGVIYRENHLISGAVEFVQALTATGAPFLFLTNNSAPTPEDLAVRLKHLGHSWLVGAPFLYVRAECRGFSERNGPGLHGFCHWRRRAAGGIARAQNRQRRHSVRVMWLWAKARPRLNGWPKRMSALNAAQDCWLQIRTIGVRCPAKKPGPVPALRRPFWKPAPAGAPIIWANLTVICFIAPAGNWLNLALGKPEEVVMIGDTMETDIRGAVEAGMPSYLVLSGSTRFEDIGDYVYQPARVLQSVADLVEEIQTGKSPDAEQPHATAIKIAHSKSGLRHQTDIFAFHKPRPRPAMTK